MYIPKRKPAVPIPASAFEASSETTVTWLSGAGFLVNCRGTCLLIDPVLTKDPKDSSRSEAGLPLKVAFPILADAIPAHCHVLYTHADADHLGPVTAQTLAKKKIPMTGTLAVFERLARLGVPPEQIEVLRTEETMEIDGIRIESTLADHPWQLKDLKRGGRPYRLGDCCGFILNTPDGRIYFPGDTRLMEQHYRIRDIDLLALDVSTCEYHLGHTSAVILANQFPSAYLMPFHYGTYDCPEIAAHRGEPEDVYPKITKSDKRGLILAPGEPFVFSKRLPV